MIGVDALVVDDALASGGRIVWPFIAWQMNRNSGSGNVTATVTSIRYVTAT